MKTVWKFPFPTEDTFAITAPAGAEFLTVQVQLGNPTLWALVDPDAPKRTYTFRHAGTGHPIADGETGAYLGTYQLQGGRLVFHVFEVVEDSK